MHATNSSARVALIFAQRNRPLFSYNNGPRPTVWQSRSTPVPLRLGATQNIEPRPNIPYRRIRSVVSWNGANETTAPSAGIGSSPASARGNSASSSGSSMRFTSCTLALASARAASRRSAAAALPPAASYRRTIRSSEPSSASLTQSNTMVPVTSVSETSGAKSGTPLLQGC